MKIWNTCELDIFEFRIDRWCEMDVDGPDVLVCARIYVGCMRICSACAKGTLVSYRSDAWIVVVVDCGVSLSSLRPRIAFNALHSVLTDALNNCSLGTCRPMKPADDYKNDYRSANLEPHNEMLSLSRFSSNFTAHVL